MTVRKGLKINPGNQFYEAKIINLPEIYLKGKWKIQLFESR